MSHIWGSGRGFVSGTFLSLSIDGACAATLRLSLPLAVVTETKRHSTSWPMIGRVLSGFGFALSAAILPSTRAISRAVLFDIMACKIC